MRLADLIQALVLDRPEVVKAVERCLRAFMVEERRKAIVARLDHLDPEQLAELDVLVMEMIRNRITDEDTTA